MSFADTATQIYDCISGSENVTPLTIENVKSVLSQLGLNNAPEVKAFYSSKSGKGILYNAIVTDPYFFLLNFIRICMQIYPTIRDIIMNNLFVDHTLSDFLMMEKQFEEDKVNSVKSHEYRAIKIKILFEIDPDGMEKFLHENQENMPEQFKKEFENACHKNNYSLKI